MKRKSVLVCGPVSNGTRLVKRICETGSGLIVHHAALPGTMGPEHQDWWHPVGMAIQHDPQHFGGHRSQQFDRVVVVFRNVHPAAMSAVSAGHFRTFEEALDAQFAARQTLLRFKSHFYVHYEELLSNPDAMLKRLGGYLGTTVSLPEPLYDANDKWQSDVVEKVLGL